MLFLRAIFRSQASPGHSVTAGLLASAFHALGSSSSLGACYSTFECSAEREMRHLRLLASISRKAALASHTFLP